MEKLSVTSITASKRILDLTSFAETQYAICSQMLEDASSAVLPVIDQHLQSYQERTTSKLHNVVFDAQNKDSLKTIIETEVQKIIVAEQETLCQSLQGEFRKLVKSTRNASRYFDEKSSKAYRNLQTLGGCIEMTSGLKKTDLQLDFSEIFASSQHLNQQLDNNFARLALATGGAAIGAFICYRERVWAVRSLPNFT